MRHRDAEAQVVSRGLQQPQPRGGGHGIVRWLGVGGERAVRHPERREDHLHRAPQRARRVEGSTHRNQRDAQLVDPHRAGVGVPGVGDEHLRRTAGRNGDRDVAPRRLRAQPIESPAWPGTRTRDSPERLRSAGRARSRRGAGRRDRESSAARWAAPATARGRCAGRTRGGDSCAARPPAAAPCPGCCIGAPLRRDRRDRSPPWRTAPASAARARRAGARSRPGRGVPRAPSRPRRRARDGRDTGRVAGPAAAHRRPHRTARAWRRRPRSGRSSPRSRETRSHPRPPSRETPGIEARWEGSPPWSPQNSMLVINWSSSSSCSG